MKEKEEEEEEEERKGRRRSREKPGVTDTLSYNGNLVYKLFKCSVKLKPI